MMAKRGGTVFERVLERRQRRRRSGVHKPIDAKFVKGKRREEDLLTLLTAVTYSLLVLESNMNRKMERHSRSGRWKSS